jgi:hypothetical protein
MPSNSFDKSNREASMNISAKSTNDPPPSNDDINDTPTPFAQDGYVDINSSDDIIQSLANVLGVTIELSLIINDKALKYIDTIKQWLQILANSKMAKEGHKYKIVARYIEIPLQQKKKWEKKNSRSLRMT